MVVAIADAESLACLSEPSWQPAEKDRLLIDPFETPIRRPSDPGRQRRTYSGKKKRHIGMSANLLHGF